MSGSGRFEAQMETEEQMELKETEGIFKKVKRIIKNWRERKAQEREQEINKMFEEALIEAQMEVDAERQMEREKEELWIEEAIEEINKEDLFEALRETEETNEIDNYVVSGELREPEKTAELFIGEQPEVKEPKGLKNWMKKAWHESAKEVLIEDLDRDVRRESRSLNYLNLSNDSYQDTKLFAQEEKTIEDVFEKYRKDLEKHFSQEEIYQLKLKFQERAKLWNELRQEGLNFRVGKINRLKTLESEFGVKSSESIRFLDALEIELKAKQKVRGLDKKIANKHKLDIIEGLWEKEKRDRARVSEGAKTQEKAKTSEEIETTRTMEEVEEPKERKKTIQEYLNEVAMERYQKMKEGKIVKIREKTKTNKTQIRHKGEAR
ncbi:MAG: hypothetical protein ACOX2N_00915 [Peptococcia bacterium]|jgi:hypothetical protein